MEMINCQLRSLCLVAALIGTGCSARQSKAPPMAPKLSSHPEYIDLQVGWKLRVVTPINKAGTYRVQFREEQQSGGEIRLKADGFVGYETAYYAVEARQRGRIQMRLVSAELMQDGKSAALSKSIKPLFALPKNTRFVRLIYLTRISDSDHDMAVVSSDRIETLDGLTRQVLANATTGCNSFKDAQCSWIPAGVAVRPEKTQ